MSGISIKTVMVLAVMAVYLPAICYAADLPVTSPFGWRIHPITGEYSFHTGVDLGYDYGTEIFALCSGIALHAGDYGDGYGNQVLLYHRDSDCYTRYAHLSAVYLSPGQLVVQGQMIGTVGATGNATGPHLHLEYIVPSTNGYEYRDPLLLWQ